MRHKGNEGGRELERHSKEIGIYDHEKATYINRSKNEEHRRSEGKIFTNIESEGEKRDI